MNPQQLCHQICKKSGSNFVYTFYLLGKKRRLALETFYAFCRLVDDSVDEAKTGEQAKEKLTFWREEATLLYQGNPTHPVSQALSSVVKEYQIPKKLLDEIVDGCEMDLNKKSYATFEELEEYCFKVASCVGLVSIRIFGVPLSEKTEKGAVALGKALQLTNILRDIVTDLGRGRVYLPEEDLKQFGISIADLAGRPKDDLNLIDLLYFEIERARTFHKQAWDAFPKTGKTRRRLVAAVLMGRVYEALLGKMSRDPLRIFQGKVSLSTGEKLKIASKEILKWLLT